jgi:hypothetical protein
MGAGEYKAYQSYLQSVQSEISLLRLALNGLESKGERGWIRMKSEGELDETRLVEGIFLFCWFFFIIMLIYVY